jgi:hypothetical protein
VVHGLVDRCLLHGEEDVVQGLVPRAAVEKQAGPLGPAFVVLGDPTLGVTARQSLGHRLLDAVFVGTSQAHLEHMRERRWYQVAGTTQVHVSVARDRFGNARPEAGHELDLIPPQVVEDRTRTVDKPLESSRVDSEAFVGAHEQHFVGELFGVEVSAHARRYLWTAAERSAVDDDDSHYVTPPHRS